MSDAMEAVFGRHQAQTQPSAACTPRPTKAMRRFLAVQNEIEAFATEHGRRPRILVAKMGQDGHDRGAKVIATAFADLGFDVDVGPLFQTPAEVAQDAVDNDVHIVGVSSQAAGHKTLVPELLHRAGRTRGPRRHRCLWRGDPAPGLRLLGRRRGGRHLRTRNKYQRGGTKGHRRCRPTTRQLIPVAMSDLVWRGLADGVINGDRRAMAKAITLVESTRPDHRADAERLLEQLLPASGNASATGRYRHPGGW